MIFSILIYQRYVYRNSDQNKARTGRCGGNLRQIAARVAESVQNGSARVDIVRKSIDARQKEVMFNLVAGLHIDRIEEKEKVFVPAYRDVSDRETVVVVGAGPAGLFAALRLIERGFRPLVLERGKAVEDRKKDLNGLYKTGMVDEDSNFGFGEGGAGTFSRWKTLYPFEEKGRCTPGYGNFGLSWSQSCYSGRSPSACRNRQITRSDRQYP